MLSVLINKLFQTNQNRMILRKSSLSWSCQAKTHDCVSSAWEHDILIFNEMMMRLDIYSARSLKQQPTDRHVSSIEAPSTSYLRGCYEGVPEVITCACITGSCITGYDVTGNVATGNVVTGTGSHETEMKGR